MAPHLFAEAAAGRLSEAACLRIARHVQACRRCARARDRVTAVREAFAGLRAAEAAEPAWDAIDVGVAARAHWEVSRARRRAPGDRARARGVARWLAPGLLGALAAVLALVSGRPLRLPSAPPPARVVAAPAPVPAPATVPVAPPAAAPLAGLVTLRKGEVLRNGQQLDFDAALGVGDELVTADGSVAIQVGLDSGFVLGEQSRARLVRFDDDSIELVVDGVIDLELAPRRAGQSFELVAADRRVSVRGTAFRVVHVEGALDVSCSHGRVVVADAGAEVSVRGGQALSVEPGQALTAVRPRPLSAEELGELVAAPVPVLPMWSAVDALRGETTALRVAAGRGEALRIDGLELGAGAAELRVLSGRHLIERRAERGQWSGGQWVSAAAGGALEVAAKASRAATGSAKDAGSQTSSAGRSKRSLDLRSQLDAGLARGCLRALAKQGLAEGSFVELELGVSADGALTHLNIVDTNLPSATAACVRDVVDGVKLGRGPRASFRERLVF